MVSIGCSASLERYVAGMSEDREVRVQATAGAQRGRFQRPSHQPRWVRKFDRGTYTRSRKCREVRAA